MIDKKLIPAIENTLNIELYPNVIKYLTEDDYNIPYDGRRIGKTTAYIIKMVLDSSIEEIKLVDLLEGKYADEIWDYHYRDWFVREFMDVREKLKDSGFKVIKIRNEDSNLI